MSKLIRRLVVWLGFSVISSIAHSQPCLSQNSKGQQGILLNPRLADEIRQLIYVACAGLQTEGWPNKSDFHYIVVPLGHQLLDRSLRLPTPFYVKSILGKAKCVPPLSRCFSGVAKISWYQPETQTNSKLPRMGFVRVKMDEVSSGDCSASPPAVLPLPSR